ncbi:hypothetical protein [Paracoccus sp. DMF]|uniref:hypothetical protein n=1 Tax=Paracoccus sp. DMF TaxID=400837 RepID=UPI001101B8B8|nr:hypothetical protein [Paracoccus sp. DMF]MCV2448481.1 hypothetical protein [Paracoccus sp. DMF]
MTAPTDKRELVRQALCAGLGYEDAAVAGRFPIPEALAIFQDMAREGELVALARRARQLAGGAGA